MGMNKNTDTQTRYQQLVILNREGVATNEERKEFYALCQDLLQTIMLKNIDVFRRLRDR